VIDELLEVTDLVMLDLKQMNDEIHQDLVGVSNHRTLEFAKYLANKNIKVWIRYVVVPAGLTMTTLRIASVNLPAIWAMSRKSNCCLTTSWVNTNGWRWVKSTNWMAFIRRRKRPWSA
jgi:pyruvate formate lyase activating enzyme